MEIRKEFTLSSAHYLPYVPVGHKCGKMHGHTYRVALTLDGQLDREMGWVIDFAEVSEIWKFRVHNQLDHQLLNDTIVNPTAEMLALWVADTLFLDLPILKRVEVWETPTSMAALEVPVDDVLRVIANFDARTSV